MNMLEHDIITLKLICLTISIKLHNNTTNEAQMLLFYCNDLFPNLVVVLTNITTTENVVLNRK